ncbi:His-Xaa-Ser system radical SAM maturase HxsC [Sphingomonas sp. Root710]|uniref:His-Xaa-Ser system radical SAM maturase HxsC n=1 Tax=Sphingomonas sp. Root710 TaxID=1736594 RepID=UPI0006F928B6|nr:His-Xaa-Ser system radical SAM maturase HxsC [Sphingomonas sp. Root710]KRB86534.1 His-Xaa-Ser system radical SAM maturase HxsC [Sphingomonas sp. Root710]
MIPLVLPAQAEPGVPYVTRLGRDAGVRNQAQLIEESVNSAIFAGDHGLVEIEGVPANDLDGDVVLVDPDAGRVERLFRSGSNHNTLLVTERCDQLCVMCSQPPKKTHVDRFALLEQACRLADESALIGISGGEPTLYKNELFELIENVLRNRPDLRFHVLSNAQHFTDDDIDRLRQPLWGKVAWGIPLYAADPKLHDEIVGKSGAADALEAGLARLIMAGARIELRTVVVQQNVAILSTLARFVSTNLQPIEQWSIMQLEHIGFARGRWAQLYWDHGQDFSSISEAVDLAELRGIPVRLFNFPRCTVPAAYRELVVPSISDWKRQYAQACDSCTQKAECSGFFAWHPETAMGGLIPL